MNHCNKTPPYFPLLVLAFLVFVSCDQGPTEPVHGSTPGGGITVDVWPKWCPADSQKIGYTHFAKDLDEWRRLGATSIWVLNTLSGQNEYITRGTLVNWSPDGGQIVFGREDGKPRLMDLHTGTEDVLPFEGYGMDFSPCGRRIAFIGVEGESSGLYIFDLDSMSISLVARRFACDWCPTGTRILCDSLIVVTESGEGVCRIPYDKAAGTAGHARWSPDGTRVVFGGACEHDPGTPAIWVIDVDGSEQRMVACPGAVASWSPTGNMIAYSARSQTGAYSAIWIRDIDGASIRQVTFP